jgi:hypothetical protein
MTQVATCPDANYDAATGTCSQVVYTDSSLLGGYLPPLSGDDGATIGFAIAVAWVSGAVWRWIAKALDA